MSHFSVLDLSTGDDELVLTAFYPFDPERVFRAWLDPAAMAQWIRPSPECQVKITRFEPHEGGRFEVSMSLDEGVFGYSGAFALIDPPRRIEMSWLWDPAEGEPYPETFVTVECAVAEGGTQLALTHSRLRSLESREAHSEGWRGSLTELAEHLASARSASSPGDGQAG